MGVIPDFDRLLVGEKNEVRSAPIRGTAGEWSVWVERHDSRLMVVVPLREIARQQLASALRVCNEYNAALRWGKMWCLTQERELPRVCLGFDVPEALDAQQVYGEMRTALAFAAREAESCAAWLERETRA